MFAAYAPIPFSMGGEEGNPLLLYHLVSHLKQPRHTTTHTPHNYKTDYPNKLYRQQHNTRDPSLKPFFPNIPYSQEDTQPSYH